MISSKFSSLKLIFSAKNLRHSRRSPLIQLWQEYRQNFIKLPEIQVWQTRDRSGNICWSGYDPANQRSISQVSEERIRAWVEQRDRRERG
ncbi:MAG: hypothetical protein HC820_03770 [Hydrococcus sp. RM1_1_31]|nr:hypothetical protein [Hydrococcus sp. RM1_1_31]